MQCDNAILHMSVHARDMRCFTRRDMGIRMTCGNSHGMPWQVAQVFCGNDLTPAATIFATIFVGFVSVDVAKFRPTPEEYLLGRGGSAHEDEANKEFRTLLANPPVGTIPPLDERERDTTLCWFDGQLDGKFAERWPLHRAVVVDDLEEVNKQLAGKLADVAMTDWFDCTALEFAIYFGRLPIALLLLEKGANPYLKNKHGRCAMDHRDRHSHMKELCAKLDALALLASPPADGIDPSLGTKLRSVLKKL